MFTETSLRKIKDFNADSPILTLYLNTEPSRGNAETHRLRLRNMLKDIPLKQDAEAIEKFLSLTYDWTGRSVAVFSCAPAGFFSGHTHRFAREGFHTDRFKSGGGTAGRSAAGVQ